MSRRVANKARARAPKPDEQRKREAAAARQRLYRQRQRDGETIAPRVRIKRPETFASYLHVDGKLRRADDTDGASLAAALELLIEEICDAIEFSTGK